MKIVSAWSSGNSYVLTIPAAFASKLKLRSGTMFKCALTASGAIKYTPTWLQPPHRAKHRTPSKPNAIH